MGRHHENARDRDLWRHGREPADVGELVLESSLVGVVDDTQRRYAATSSAAREAVLAAKEERRGASRAVQAKADEIAGRWNGSAVRAGAAFERSGRAGDEFDPFVRFLGTTTTIAYLGIRDMYGDGRLDDRFGDSLWDTSRQQPIKIVTSALVARAGSLDALVREERQMADVSARPSHW